MNPIVIKSIVLAAGICFLNAAAAIATARIAFGKTWGEFSKLTFGSLVARYFLMIFAMWASLSFLRLDKFAFAMTFLISAFVFLFAEILYFNYNLSELKKRK